MYRTRLISLMLRLLAANGLSARSAVRSPNAAFFLVTGICATARLNEPAKSRRYAGCRLRAAQRPARRLCFAVARGGAYGFGGGGQRLAHGLWPDLGADCLQGLDALRQEIAIAINEAVQLPEQGRSFFVG